MPTGYGKKIRAKVSDVKKKSSRKYKCPSCSRTAVKRLANGVWKCRKCDIKYASGAFEFKS